MVLELLFAIVLLVILAYITIRVVQSVALGIFLVAIIFTLSYLVIGTFPNLKTIPVIGQFFSFIPSTTGDAIVVIRDAFFKMDIIGTGRDSENKLMVMVANMGSFDLSDFKVLVDNTTVNIINKHKDSLKPKETTTIQTDWKEDFDTIVVETGQIKAIYAKQ